MNSYRFLFNSPCTRTAPIYLARAERRTCESTTLQISCRSQIGRRCVVRVDEPAPILQVKSADAAECKVHRCITRNRSCNVSFETCEETEKKKKKIYICISRYDNKTRVYSSLFFLCKQFVLQRLLMPRRERRKDSFPLLSLCRQRYFHAFQLVIFGIAETAGRGAALRLYGYRR